MLSRNDGSSMMSVPVVGAVTGSLVEAGLLGVCVVVVSIRVEVCFTVPVLGGSVVFDEVGEMLVPDVAGCIVRGDGVEELGIVHSDDVPVAGLEVVGWKARVEIKGVTVVEIGVALFFGGRALAGAR
jgi:hypothetical protein